MHSLKTFPSFVDAALLLYERCLSTWLPVCGSTLGIQGLKIIVDTVGSVGSTTGKGWLVDVDAIVLDEVHYLSDISRGTVWEETVSSFLCLIVFGTSTVHEYNVFGI